MTFAPDGPLRQLIIPQMRLLKERAAFKPSQGPRRIFSDRPCRPGGGQRHQLSSQDSRRAS